jgi:hypothetical protein
MTQLEIKFFWPLTEQIDLDLDYKLCNEFEEEKRKKWLSDSVLTLPLDANGAYLTSSVTASTFQFKPNPTCVGYWEVSPGVQVWRQHRPNWLHQKMTKVFFGWKWNNKGKK